MKEVRRLVVQAAALVALGAVVGAAVNFPLVKRFVRGEFRETFFEAARYPGVRLITLQEAEDLWAGGQTVLLDARPVEAFALGHAPGARNIPSARDGFEVPAGVLALAREAVLVVYCEGGDCQSSLALARRLHDEGFRDIRVFSGGWDEWRAAGLPEEQGEGRGPQGESGAQE
ncbi:MAG: rhodanese-like domain-containing protein [Candidatus Aminicenantes bacterium]|nr:rhodanese-like domain-containing protein [Candidatus Aminicenantes bacterium]NLH75969.1 rhodanese-like domain-containing protein [Acidobacteriota bacterium]